MSAQQDVCYFNILSSHFCSMFKNKIMVEKLVGWFNGITNLGLVNTEVSLSFQAIIWLINNYLIIMILNLVKEINTLGIPLIRYSGPFLKWTREDFKQMDPRTRKLMTMHKALHSRDDIDRLYVLRKAGGRGLANSEDSIVASIQQLKDYIEKLRVRLISTTGNNTDNTRINRMKITRKQRWEE